MSFLICLVNFINFASLIRQCLTNRAAFWN